MSSPSRVALLLLLLSTTTHAQRLYGQHKSLELLMAPTYPSERCAFYDVRRLSWLSVQQLQRNAPSESDIRRWPRLGELSQRDGPNLTVCDGYGISRRQRIVTPCEECPGEPFRREVWSVLLCSPAASIAPLPPPTGPPVSLLLIGSDHNNHGLFAQVERVLNQLHLAEYLGLPPYVYLGRKVHAAPWSCDVGENQYFSAAYTQHGGNVWEYYFEQVSTYEIGSPTLQGRPVRLLMASAEDARRHAIYVSRDAVTSYFEFKRYDKDLHEIRTRVRRMGALLVGKWVRIKPEIRKEAAGMLREWRGGGGSAADGGGGAMTPLLGVHLRGTDKVTHPKIPIQRFFKPIDAYLQAYPNAKILLCSDDASYHARMRKRYGEEKLVSASTGYSTDNIVRDPSIDRYQKGRSGLLDALLLAHTDFLLKGTSSLSEFALWYNPSLIERHMDLQIEGDGAESATYKSLIPKWMGGPYEPAPLTAEQQPAAMLAKLAAGTSAAGRPAERLEATAVQQSIDQAAASVEQGGGFGGRRARRRKRNVMAPNTRRQQRRQLKKALTIKEVAGDEWAKVSKVPEWPLPATSPQDIAVAADPGAHAELAAAIRYTQIKSGSCAGKGLKLLSMAECEILAGQQSFHFIGRTSERNEYPGCVLWEPNHVEFNNHADEKMGCGGGDKSGRPPSCLCGAPK